MKIERRSSDDRCDADDAFVFTHGRAVSKKGTGHCDATWSMFIIILKKIAVYSEFIRIQSLLKN